ncbi:MAG: hypothetical protein JXB42_05705 [Deltaproteobacteria bacterium]|nr:hypothetical protein [Deltaproteobacteria bacterium]
MYNQTENTEGIIIVDSVNYLDVTAREQVVIASSHGGIYAAYKSADIGARAVILNDAGVGRQDAGIACLQYCEEIGMAAAVVSHTSARIGDAADMFQRGMISHANQMAKNVRCIPGIEVARAAACLKKAPLPFGKPPVYDETRFVISDGRPKIVCIDSASLVKKEDAGQVVITGSHGGLIGGRKEKAFNVQALIAVFNDAGVGIDQAGIGRLDPLDERGIAAATVAHTSARIGDSRSTYYEGVISYANQLAIKLGASLGAKVRDFVECICQKGAS